MEIKYRPATEKAERSLIGGDMRRDLKTYVWQKDIERRKKDRRKKVVNGIIIEDYDRRKEGKENSLYNGPERRNGENRRSGKNRRLK